jgi:1-acyl-sn-glycerol-3-phosphate acyltransferase
MGELVHGGGLDRINGTDWPAVARRVSMIESVAVLAQKQPPDRPAPPSPAGPPPLDTLTPFERRSVRLMDLLYRRARPATELWLRKVSQGWMTLGSWRMVVPVGLERLAGLTAQDRILLVSNHRSFFDMYMLALQLGRFTPLKQPVLSPVRGDFFYERPLGVAVNLLVGGGRMFPPFFRDPGKNEFNKWALKRVAEALREGPPVIVGFHPEGRRNRTPDPYTPLPAQPGVGKLVMEAWPIVVPAFINGMSSNFIADIRSNFTGERKCIAVFGAPVDLTPFRGMSNRLASHKRLADRLLEVIFELAREERATRAALGVK